MGGGDCGSQNRAFRFFARETDKPWLISDMNPRLASLPTLDLSKSFIVGFIELVAERVKVGFGSGLRLLRHTGVEGPLLWLLRLLDFYNGSLRLGRRGWRGVVILELAQEIK
ncbi:hypothetical protein EVAR_20725_1 [Eumeta japonica]|uniref:Uncharacterized protein n=1 Tax=Eumeta variegata TaxID=151549 RepID=A0A4C1VAE1_EUMVA|nr:hypothetical protein EVAR_20725_1 [Eumeta japonica]